MKNWNSHLINIEWYNLESVFWLVPFSPVLMFNMTHYLLVFKTIYFIFCQLLPFSTWLEDDEGCINKRCTQKMTSQKHQFPVYMATVKQSFLNILSPEDGWKSKLQKKSCVCKNAHVRVDKTWVSKGFNVFGPWLFWTEPWFELVLLKWNQKQMQKPLKLVVYARHLLWVYFLLY